jgi:NAD(P)-dependent dehydrogenase (short-subunit alcohol dehydrogenase family)
MNKTLVICGVGPGISEAVAWKFGRAGFQIALAARSAPRLEDLAARLGAEGIVARAFPTDLGEAGQIVKLFADVDSALGPATVVHWNAYIGGAGDFLSATPDELRSVMSIGALGIVTAAQAAVPRMAGQDDPAFLVTGGGLSSYDDNVDRMAIQWKAMGLAATKAAQNKITRLLHFQLAERGIYVGEVTVTAVVKGTSFDAGHGTLEASTVADTFFKIYQERNVISVAVG